MTTLPSALPVAMSSGAASIPAASSPSLQRLVSQIHSLSELTESLAFRLLELEERLAAQEVTLQPLLEADAARHTAGSADSDLRLDDTEQRLARIEELLGGAISSGVARVDGRLEALSEPEATQESFYEEEEQHFMDEELPIEEEPSPLLGILEKSAELDETSELEDEELLSA